MRDRDDVRDGGNVELCGEAREEGFGRRRVGRDDVSIWRIAGQ